MFDWKKKKSYNDFIRVYQVMELELKKLQDTVTSIHDEMFFLRER